MSTVATVPVMIVLVLIILLPFIVGFFVYRDARQRNMNASSGLSWQPWPLLSSASSCISWFVVTT